MTPPIPTEKADMNAKHTPGETDALERPRADIPTATRLGSLLVRVPYACAMLGGAECSHVRPLMFSDREIEDARQEYEELLGCERQACEDVGTIHCLEHQNEELIAEVLKWWNDHRFDTVGLEDGDEINVWNDAPSFVLAAMRAHKNKGDAVGAANASETVPVERRAAASPPPACPTCSGEWERERFEGTEWIVCRRCCLYCAVRAGPESDDLPDAEEQPMTAEDL